MKYRYVAKLYLGRDEIKSKEGSDCDVLYAWMLAYAEDKFGNIHGEIIDSKKRIPIKKFRKVPPE